MSYETQIIEATYVWASILKNGKGEINVIFVDFCKAFDLVPHHHSLMKLYMFSITGITHRWIECVPIITIIVVRWLALWIRNP